MDKQNGCESRSLELQVSGSGQAVTKAPSPLMKTENCPFRAQGSLKGALGGTWRKRG